MTKLRLCVCLIAVLAGCREATKVDVPATVEHIKQKEADRNRAYAAHDANAVASTYADDATLANPDKPLVTGILAIRDQTRNLGSDPNFTLQVSSERVQVASSGDFAYSRGNYILTKTDPTMKKLLESKGSYLTVWRMQGGTWKAVEEFMTPRTLAAH